ncbi:dihydrofolate reductase family protein [Nocardia farcinica]|uniref:dihydrofolate reductase family protein n=1 Tax=Nocardia farcinica TaxID=37329 RepID=UPI00189349BC|nr:dihydrofolate reductase family protein [Nocardia farcinica]MBF6522513.1 dihydrofolate reductase [Nocardia farcinica]
MTTTQFYTATTLDGFLADSDNSLSWLFAVPGAGDAEAETETFFAGVGAMCMGATTYEWILANDAPENWVKSYGDTPCWVFTHRELPRVPGANLHFVAEDVRPVHERMREAAGGGNIWVVGGGDLAGQFADAGLLDELILAYAPVTLGAGAPLLPRRILADRLTLTKSTTVGQFAMLTYRLAAPA